MARDPEVVRLITKYARQYGVDPRAALAVAMTEGGLGRGAVGDQGSSFGPFQLHVGGALPSGRGAGWANSPAGLEYAVRQMGQSGARGLTGRAAVESIVRNFERPADPGSEIGRALGNYGGVQPIGGGGPPQALPGSPADPRAMFGRALLRATQSGNYADLLNAAIYSRKMKLGGKSSPLTAPDGQAITLPGASGKLSGQWHVTPQLLNLAGRFGLSITSGFRSVAKQAQIYAHRSGSGTVAAPGKSWHNSGHAVDVAVNGASMKFVAFARAHPGLFREVFYDGGQGPSIYIKNGVLYKGRKLGGHSDHVHIAITGPARKGRK